MNHARHIIHHISDPRVLSESASDDVASSMCRTLRQGEFPTPDGVVRERHDAQR